ncbi:MAG: HAD family hydrolase [Xanthobacteraceae bacterium]|nr:HAD family hydrolase [Xanthobacteraceae bacterium]
MPGGAQDLAFADVEQGLTLLGLVGLIDPPREEAIAAVAECGTAGIRVKMITGDHAATAGAVARRLGMDNHDAVITGEELERLDAEAFRRAAREKCRCSRAPAPSTSCGWWRRCRRKAR